MAALGAHPRLSAMMLSARGSPGEVARAAELAAHAWRSGTRSGGGMSPVDVCGLRLEALSGHAEADRGALARIRQQSAQYRRRLRTTATPDGEPGGLLAAAYPDRIAQRREPGSFRFSGGGGAKLPRGDALSTMPLLVVAALDPKGAALIRLAAPLDAARLPAHLAASITETVESGFDAATGSVLSRRRRRLGALILDDRTVAADAGETAAVLADATLKHPEALPWTPAARQLQARAAILRTLEAAVPDLSDRALAASVQEWLAPALVGASRLADVARVDLAALLRGRLGWEAARQVDTLLPTAIDLPGGRAAVDYEQPVPVASARAQHFYGLDQTPRLAGGRVPLRLALLSPAGRPIAVTGDLAGFWRGAWADARRDMRGRYPRHDWPENPVPPNPRAH